MTEQIQSLPVEVADESRPAELSNPRGASRELRHGWLALLAAFVGIAAGGSTLQAHAGGAMFLAITKTFGWTRGELSLSQTGFSVLTFVSTPLVGALVDRFGVRRVAAGAILGCAAIFWVISQFQGSLAWFIFLMAALGLVAAATSAVVYLTLVTMWFDRMRGLAIGIAMAGTGVAAVILPKVMIPLVAEHGWRLGYQTLALVMLATLPLIVIGARYSTAVQAAQTSSQPTIGGMTFEQSLRTSQFWRLGFVNMMVGMGLGGIYTHFVPLLSDHGLKPADAANVAATFGLAILIGRLLAGYLCDRVFAPLVGAGAISLAVLGLASLLTDGTAQLWVAAVGAGLATGTEHDLTGYATARYFGRRAYGKNFSVLFSMFVAGGMLSPVVYGYTHDRTGTYTVALMASTLLLAVAIPVLLSLGPYPDKGEPTGH